MTSSYWGPMGASATAGDYEDKDIFNHDDNEHEVDEEEGDEDEEVDDDLHLKIPYQDGEYPDDNDMCRGYGTQTNLEYDRDSGFDAPNHHDSNSEHQLRRNADEGEPVVSMPADFYSNVENFLSKGPPALGAAAGRKKKKKKGSITGQHGDGEKKVGKKVEKAGSSDSVFLPQIHNTQGSASKQIEKPPPLPTAAVRQKVAKRYSVGQTGISGTTRAGPNKQIDQDLLKEAFAYTDKLLKEALLEEQQQQINLEDQKNRRYGSMSNITDADMTNKRTNKMTSVSLQDQQEIEGRVHAKSAPADIEHSSVRKKQHGTGLSAYKASVGGGGGSMVKKLRNRTSQNRNVQQTHSSTTHAALQQHEYLRSGAAGSKKVGTTKFNVHEMEEKDMRRNVINYDELVANFQNGTTLQALQKELEMSKKSMARSEQFLRDLSKEYFS